MQHNPQVIPYQYMQRCPSSQKLILNNNPPYNSHIKDVLHNHYQEVKELGIFSTVQSTPNLFFYKAQDYQENLATAIEDYMLQEVERFCKDSTQTFAIAYVHSCFLNFITFRKCLEKWPEHFFRRLRRVYIVEASFVVKIIEFCSFGTFYRLCDSLFLHVDKIQDLKEADAAVMRALGENDLYGKRIEDYELQSGKYPIIILRLLSRLVSNPSDLRVSGIFRKCCSCKQLQRLEEAVAKNNLSSIDQEKDVHVICDMLKKLLHKLKQPLFNNAIYEHIVAFQGTYTAALLREIYAKMEFVSQKVFVLVFTFLSEYVVPETQHNLTGPSNLSILFAPCFFQAKQLNHIKKFTTIIELFFEHQKSVIPQAERLFAQAALKPQKQNCVAKFRQTV